MIILISVCKVVLIVVLFVVFGLQVVEVVGIKVDDMVCVGGKELLLNGVGLCSKLFIKVYVGVFYVNEKVLVLVGVFDSMVLCWMVLWMLCDFGVDVLYEVLEEGLVNNYSLVELVVIKL